MPKATATVKVALLPKKWRGGRGRAQAAEPKKATDVPAGPGQASNEKATPTGKAGTRKAQPRPPKTESQEDKARRLIRERYGKRARKYWSRCVAAGGAVVLYNRKACGHSSPLSNMSPFGFRSKGGETWLASLEHGYVQMKIWAYAHSAEGRARKPFDWYASQIKHVGQLSCPLKAKALGGRLVPRSWSQGLQWNLGGQAMQAMTNLLTAKYRQNAEARRYLLETGDNFLAELQGNNFWAVGVHPDPLGDGLKVPAEHLHVVQDPRRFPGLNVQGILTMGVRDKARAEWVRSLPPPPPLATARVARKPLLGDDLAIDNPAASAQKEAVQPAQNGGSPTVPAVPSPTSSEEPRGNQEAPVGILTAPSSPAPPKIATPQPPLIDLSQEETPVFARSWEPRRAKRGHAEPTEQPPAKRGRSCPP